MSTSDRAIRSLLFSGWLTLVADPRCGRAHHMRAAGSLLPER
eukprot:COSAG01_NODE_64638_length_275_cov_238.079545_1_plen_41_part_01